MSATVKMRYILSSFLIWTFGENYISVAENRNPFNVYLMTLPLDDSAFTLENLIKATAGKKHLTNLPMDIQINRLPVDGSSQESFAEKFDNEKTAYENENMMRTFARTDEGDEGYESKIQKAVEGFVVNKTMSVIGKLSESMDKVQNSFNSSIFNNMFNTVRDSNKIDPEKKLVFNIVVNRKPSDENNDVNEDNNDEALKDWEMYLKSFEQKRTTTPYTKFDKNVERLLSKMVRLRST